jgi:hypothetical protein
MRIDYHFPFGTPCDIEQLDANVYRCTPMKPGSGSCFYYVGLRIDDLAAGEQAKLILRWPPVWTEADVPDYMDKLTAGYMTKLDHFVLALDRTTVISDDPPHWRTIPGITIDADAAEATVPLVGTGKPLYVATMMPYLPQQYDELLELVEADDRCEVVDAGQTRAGYPIKTITIAPPDGGSGRCAYVQGYVHSVEYTGPHVIDTMIRRLLSDDPPPHAAGLTWQFTPIFDVDGLRHYGEGYGVGTWSRPCIRRKNPNRDWTEGEWPEVATMRQFFDRQVEAGRNYVLALDLHNGWSKLDKSGACYTVVHGDDVPEADTRRQQAFVDWMLERTDHAAPGSYWWRGKRTQTFSGYFRNLTGALSSTVEFPRHIWWSRAKGAYVSFEPGHPHRFAQDALAAIDAYFSGEPSGESKA